MTARDFVFWLQGWLEMERPKSISPARLQMIQEHLHLVFQHDAGGPPPPAMDHPTPVEKGPPASCDGPVEPDKRKVLQEELDEAASKKELEDIIKRLQVPYRRGWDGTKLIC